MKKTNLKRKTLSISLKSLAFALGFTAAASTTSYAMPVKETKTIENHDHEHEYDSIDEVVVKMTETYSNNNEKVYKLISIKEIENPSISNYKGGSIVEALNLCGINSSFSNRKQLALNSGIENYKGTAEQNIELLNKLKSSNINSVAKVSDIKNICRDLFGKDAYKVINDLKLPNTANITKSEFARIIRSIANYMGVNTSTYDNKLDLVKNVISDVNLETSNNNDIAWSYYMGYADLDEKSNYNANNLLSINELNNWIRSFTNDYNLAVNSKNYSDNGLIVIPSLDKYERDNKDFSKINEIRNPQSYSSNQNNNNSSNKEDKDDIKEKHHHKYGKWIYYDENSEVSICNDCGSVKYQKHKLNNISKEYQSNDDGSHIVNESGFCNSCHTTIDKEYTTNCEFNEWSYDSVANKDERECKHCGYTETRTHEHNVPTNLQYNYFASNNDGTHKLKATYVCNKCNETIELYKDVDCSLGAWTYNHATGKDERKCVCGYTETRTHEHDREPSNLTYTLDGPNYDGTHKYKASYTCNACSSIITLTKDEECKYDDDAWTKHDGVSCKNLCIVCEYEKYKNHNFIVVPNSITGNATLGKHNVTQKCDDCDYTKEVEENCISNGARDYFKDGNIVTVREYCSLCNEVCVDDPHTHSYSYTTIDNDQHRKFCECNYYESIEGHSYGEWTLNNGQNTRECSECHNVQTIDVEQHICSLRPNNIEPASPGDNYCYLRVTLCEGCDYRRVDEVVQHNYVVTKDEPFYTIYTCSNEKCNSSYSVEKTMSFSIRKNDLEDENIVSTDEVTVVEEIIEEPIIEEPIIEEPIVEEEIEEEIIEEEKGKVLVLK